jgi:hypothetical protein
VKGLGRAKLNRLTTFVTAALKPLTKFDRFAIDTIHLQTAVLKCEFSISPHICREALAV